MKRTLALVGLFFIGLLLLFNPDTGVVTLQASPTTSTIAPTQTTSAEPPTPASTSDGPEEESTTTVATSTGTFLGLPAGTEFGSFQVEIVVENGLVVGIDTVQEPSDRHSRRINDYAIPLYEEAAISSQSADIDAISGATVTWQAWTESLDSALQEAGL